MPRGLAPGFSNITRGPAVGPGLYAGVRETGPVVQMEFAFE
jgi:hypothetical protein